MSTARPGRESISNKKVSNLLDKIKIEIPYFEMDDLTWEYLKGKIT